MSFNYLDTSALMRWVENDVAAPRPRDAHGAAIVQSLLDDHDATCGLCWLTLVELRSAISQDWRMGEPEYAQFDPEWATRANFSVMSLVADQRVQVVDAPPRAAEHAATLVHLATEEHKIALGTWDAIHLITAARWARDRQTQVRLYTADEGFARFITRYPEFVQFVEVNDLNP